MNASGTGKFRDAYDNQLVGKNLDLMADNGAGGAAGVRDRSAGVAYLVEQPPKPVTIAGTVFHDRDLDLVREPNVNPALDEHGIDGVTLELWKLNETTLQYENTGHTTVTAGGGKYEFGANLNLLPGVYEVREGDAVGYFDVGAIPGTVDGAGKGAADGKNVLTAVELPLGGMHAINYDFAEAKLAQVSGFVYHDVDDDGNFEPLDPTAPETGLGGIRMLIQPMDWPLPGAGTPPTPPSFGPGGGRVTAIVTTNGDGSYLFDNMRPGQYRVIQLDQHPDYSDGKETAGTVDGAAVGTAINPLEPGRIDAIVLGSGSVGVDYNFGEIIL
ncbi:MAG: hypothetical protein KDA41_06075, partial [Planctomycetales bacterium]|nr:hypothetical protein [Planctomycetales bacterium]